MSCDITAGIAKGCKDSIGGLSKLYLFNNLENPFTVAAGVATAMNVAITTVYKFDLVGDASTLTESMVSDRQTGTVTNTQTIVAAFHKQAAATSAQFNLMAKGYPMGVVKTRDGKYHAIGITEGIDFTIEAASGGAHSDMNGYTITGVSIESALSPQLDTATTAAFLAEVV